MFNFISKLFDFILNFWSELSESTKENILKAIVDVFESIFRDFYRSEKTKNGENNV